MKVRSKPDSIDIEQLQELGVNFGYRIVSERLRAALHQARVDLEQAESWDKTRVLQGRIAGLILALQMPDQLLAEYKAKQEK